jgi:hypothetical protein
MVSGNEYHCNVIIHIMSQVTWKELAKSMCTGLYVCMYQTRCYEYSD